MADEDGGSRRGEVIAAVLTLGLAVLLGLIAADLLRKKRPCGCQDQEVPDGDA